MKSLSIRTTLRPAFTKIEAANKPEIPAPTIKICDDINSTRSTKFDFD